MNEKNSYMKLFLVMMIFVLPIIVSWFLYSFHDKFRFKTLNYGTLVSPSINVEKILKKDSKKQWQIVYAPKVCTAEQADKLMFTLHQLRIALGKDRDRVNLVLLVDPQCQIKDTHDFSKFVFTDQQFMQLQHSFNQVNNKNFVTNDKIYLVDPLGNLFMYYTSTTNPMNILKDLKKVLEVSQIG